MMACRTKRRKQAKQYEQATKAATLLQLALQQALQPFPGPGLQALPL